MVVHLRILFLCFIFSVVSWGSHADQTLSPEMYWKHVLPYTPMPKAITDSLHPEWLENKGTSVTVGKGGVGVHTGKPGGGGTHVGVGKGGVGVTTGGKPGHGHGGTHVGVGKGGVGVTTGPKRKPVYVGVHPGRTPFLYRYAATEAQLHDDPNVALFFLQKDLKPGSKMTLQFTRSGAGAAFLPRRVATSIPFSSAEFPAILRRFSVSPGSEEANVMKETISQCEQNDAVAMEEKYCATSLESMVDFAVSGLGGGRRRVRAVSTDAAADDGRRKEFTVAAAREVSGGGGGVVACHKEGYPYAVFYCHKTASSAAYTVDLAAEGKAEVQATAVCHKDTSAWNPKHVAFQVLKVKPGTVPICHFLPEDHVIWFRN